MINKNLQFGHLTCFFLIIFTILCMSVNVNISSHSFTKSRYVSICFFVITSLEKCAKVADVIGPIIVI